MSTLANPIWSLYLRTPPTAKVSYFRPPREVAATGSSSAAREPNLHTLHEQLNRVGQLRKNWDSYGSARPDRIAIERTRQLIETAYKPIAELTGWQSPSVTASENGEIVLEWWHGARKLTIYVGPRETTYVKSWGPHLVNEMEDGPLPEDWIASRWLWLFG